MLRVRPYLPNDRDFVLGLAPRFAKSIGQHNQKTMVMIAEDEDRERLGFATVSHSTHLNWISTRLLG